MVIAKNLYISLVDYLSLNINLHTVSLGGYGGVSALAVCNVIPSNYCCRSHIVHGTLVVFCGLEFYEKMDCFYYDTTHLRCCTAIIHTLRWPQMGDGTNSFEGTACVYRLHHELPGR